VAPEPSCDLCMHTTQAGNVVTRTLLFHTYYSCTGFVIGTYTHNHTTYLVCSHGNQHICFNPTYCPWSNGWRSGASATLGTSSAAPRCLVLINQCQCSLMHVQPYISCGCGELAWERAYTSNNKYMCWEDSSWPCNDVGSYCPYWDLVSWATW
jgi:hypothetical protein